MIDKIIYDIGMWLGQVAQAIGSLFHPKAAARQAQLRAQSRLVSGKSCDANRILFHCASFGEFEQIKPLIKKVKTNHSTSVILLSFFSPSGYEMAIEYEYADEIYYLPIDTKRNMRFFINSLSPKAVVLLKYEIWPNFIHQLVKSHIPVYLVCSTLFKDQIYFKWYAGILRNALRQLNKIYVQDKSSNDLLNEYNISSVVAGDTRADRVYERSEKINPEIINLKAWKGQHDTLVLGSIWPEDWALVKPILGEILKDYKLIVAPHEIGTNFIKSIEQDLGNNVQRWTSWANSDIGEPKVLLLDTVGLLADVYRYGSVAYVGGAFKQGLHNILEPAIYGLPILFGPEIDKFREAEEMVGRKLAFSVHDSGELLAKLKILKKEEARSEIGKKVKQYVLSSVGSTDALYRGLSEIWD